MKQEKTTPVILDTDIGSDIDDTWALAMMLKSPELDIKLMVSGTGDTDYRSRIIARLLETAGRADIPVGVGTQFEMKEGRPQGAWVEGYSLSDYKGQVCEDGVGAIIETIMGSSEPITLIGIGPLPNIAEALRREPRIAENARFIGMHGSVRKGYGGSSKISPEYNVFKDIPACQEVFAAPWDITITPLDTCGVVVLGRDRYQRVRQCADPLIQAVIENYRLWLEAIGRPELIEQKSSVLYDTVAVYLAMTEAHLVMENLPMTITDDGYTRIDETGRPVYTATEWKDLYAFKDFLTNRLTGRGVAG
jgi:inosine-uridine nucleoside N-ribohydrolase